MGTLTWVWIVFAAFNTVFRIASTWDQFEERVQMFGELHGAFDYITDCILYGAAVGTFVWLYLV